MGGDINSDGTALVAAGTFGPYVEVVSIIDGQRLWGREFEDRWVTGAYFIEDDQKVIVGVVPDPSKGPVDEDSVGLFILDASTGELIHHEFLGSCGAYLPQDPAGVSNTKTVLFLLPGTDCSQRSIPIGSYPDVSIFDVTTGVLVHLGVSASDLGIPVPHPFAAISGDGAVAAFDVGIRRMSYRDTASGEPLSSGIEEWNQFIALNRDGSRTITGAFEGGGAIGRPDHLGKATVFDSWSGEEIASFDGHETLPGRVVFSPDGDTAYSVGSDGFVRAWDPSTGEEVSSAPGGLDPRTVAVSGDGRHLLVFDSGAQARVLDMTPEVAVEIRRGRGKLFEAELSAESDDGVVRAQIDYPPPYFAFTVSRRDSDQTLRVLQRDLGEDGWVAFIPNTHQVIVAWPNQMFLVDGDSLTITRERNWATDGPLPMEWLTVSPDGQFAVGTYTYPFSQGGRPSIEVFDLPTLDPLVVIEDAHAGTITNLAVSRSGDLIASSARDEWVRIWSSGDGSLVHAIQAPGPVRGVEFGEDDRHVVATLDDATAYEYTLDPTELLDIARSRLSRGFTEAECMTYGLDPCPTLEEMQQP